MPFTFDPNASFDDKMDIATRFKTAVNTAQSAISSASVITGVSPESTAALNACAQALQGVALEAEAAFEAAGSGQ
jgi:hypothetical protein